MLFNFFALLPMVVLAATTTTTAPRAAAATTTTPARVVTTTRQVTTTGAAKVVTSVKTVTSTLRGYTTVVKGATSTVKGYTTTVRVTTTLPASTKRTTLTTTLRAATTPAKAVTSPARAATTTARPATTTTPRAAAAPAATAPTTPNLYPRLIVPVVAGQGAQGTQYFVTVAPTTKSDLLFDIAPASGYKTCTLVGRFPVGGSPTSSGAYGSAQVQAQLLASNINTATSAANQPAVKTDLGTRAAGTATNGANAIYASFPVTAGQSYSIVLSAVSGSIRLFEDYNAPVVGYTLNCV